MKKLGLYFFSAFITGLLVTCSTEKRETDEHNNIRKYLTDVASAISDSSFSGIKTLADWQNEKGRRYKELVEMMGLTDVPLDAERSPLNIKVTGTVKEEGFHIEKLYYESLPGLYVRANLYVPDNIKKPGPAILYVCGHSPSQKVHYQAHPRKFAQLGFVCLIIETIQFGEVKGEHWGPYANGCFHWYSRGYNPAGVELWNAIRGIDLLAARPDVDPDNIGVTGISGGGSQSWYIAAIDPRIKAVAPVCGASTLKAQVTSRTIDGHCDCMMPINTYGQDFMDFGALIAPRPLLICQAERDGMNTIESVRELYDHIRRIYKLYDATDHIGLVETPGGHSYHKISREKIFSFFIQHLMDKQVLPEEAGDVDVSGSGQLSDEVLRVYTDGPPADDRTTTIQDSFVRLPSAPLITNKEDLIAFRDSVKEFLNLRTFGAFPDERPKFKSILEFRTLDGARFGEEIFSFVPENGWRLKVDINWANKSDSPGPLLIILRNYDDERWAAEAFASEIEDGQNIAYFETRGIGEFGWAPGLQWHVRRASAWTGRTVASMQVFDLIRCMEFCRTLPGVDPARISIAARNEMGAVALYAALMDGKCESLILKNPPETQNLPSDTDGKGPAIEMLNSLRVIDIYQIPALLSPAKIAFYGAIPPSYKWSEDILVSLGKEAFKTIPSN